jgi:hypothetical protein
MAYGSLVLACIRAFNNGNLNTEAKYMHIAIILAILMEEISTLALRYEDGFPKESSGEEDNNCQRLR